MKKLIAILLTALMLAGIFTGCKAKKEENKMLRVAALSSGYEATKAGMWKEVCDAFTNQTGIKVELTLEKNLEDVISASMQGGDFPDVVLLATGREAGLTEQFIRDKNLTELTDLLSMTIPGESKKVKDKIAGGFTDSVATNPYGDGKTYLMPMFYSPCGLFYNKGLFEQKGWEVPKTWDEMWALGDKAKKEGIYLFTYPTTGYFDAFFYALMYSVGGADFFDKATHYEKGIWDSDKGKLCLDIVAKLASYTNPKTPAQANDQDFTKNQLLVMQNEALFMPNGTWIVGEMKDAKAAEGFKWGMTALPAVKADGNRYSYTWIEQIWVPKGAENVKDAKKFVSYMYSDKACEIFASRNAIQPVLNVSDKLNEENKLFYSIYDNGAKAAMGNFAAYKSVAGLGSINEVFFDPINSLVSGKLTKEKWIEDIKKANVIMRENLIKDK
ncbi:MAG: carbohydrate ABC transporter substrate-binding protein [Clostridia bacterium]|nr:carbohydrate ABC transporter substrate-binding protein [Clostridia bacterium]